MKSEKLFVKFVPWNKNTLSLLINKSIKFSTVFEFNDFNEYLYMGLSKIASSEERSQIKKIIQEKMNQQSFRENFLKLIQEKGTVSYLDNIIECLNSSNYESLLENPNILPLLEENAAYSSVGIFSMSDIKVFDDDSAQIMFAHYADNLKGLALILESTHESNIKKIIDIDYRNIEEGKFAAGRGNRLANWVKGQYDDIGDFRKKSSKWEYENEKRIFGIPGIKPLADLNLKLRSILFTTRFLKEDEKLLNKINKLVYENMLSIQQIFPDIVKRIFVTELKASGCLKSYLKRLLTPKKITSLV